jgi:hypothetical protein
MGSKSRRSRRKHSLQTKKRKRKQISTLMASQQPAVAQTYEPTAPSKVTPPPAKEPTPTVARYPQISSELRRIGILAGIMLVTLVVLAFVLP